MSVKKAFDKVAGVYDETRKQLIPCFDDFYGTVQQLVSLIEIPVRKVLDLGAGTGLLTAMVSSILPDAEYTLCDISDNMLDVARKRFQGEKIETRYLVSDYSTEHINEKYDVIVSGLSIHHLTGQKKEALFQKLFNNLNEGGMFINADQVMGKTKEIDNIYRSTWIRQVKENGTTDETLQAAFERMKQDKMSTLPDQLKWLKDAGLITSIAGLKVTVSSYIPERSRQTC